MKVLRPLLALLFSEASMRCIGLAAENTEPVEVAEFVLRTLLNPNK